MVEYDFGLVFGNGDNNRDAGTTEVVQPAKAGPAISPAAEPEIPLRICRLLKIVDVLDVVFLVLSFKPTDRTLTHRT